ncbi:MAG: DUF1361 domain-containing protein [Treponema sp.]|jgi:uncharacterized membrane protein|nr:DUF1361 domain-containing protein [Treponema sp.]
MFTLIKHIPGKNPNARRLREALFMAALSFFCFCMSIFRWLYTGAGNFLFLNWNLFLAFIPWALTSLAAFKSPDQKPKSGGPGTEAEPGVRREIKPPPKINGPAPKFPRRKAGFWAASPSERIKTILLVICWLLFFPNAPYILTDLLYLRLKTNMPVWYDLLLILSFAWTGLLFGFLSLWNIEKILSRFFRPLHTTIISTVFLFIGSFGIYIGRYLRWNSWDVITEPLGLMYDIGYRFINPHEHPGTWGMTIFMGLFLNMLYWSFRFIRKRDNPL